MRLDIIQPIFRVFAGMTIVLLSVYFAHRWQTERYIEDHHRYIICLQSGQQPKVCSISAVFSPQKYNTEK
jgi:hypothetical protein